MRCPTLAYFLVTSLAATTACSISDDGIWMPPGADGKADAYTTIKGSDIPSQYVNANKYYMISRNIENLTKVGALDQAQTDLAKRVDGIIANSPANGAMHLAELVRMEDPTIFGSLFPAEKAALPKLWALVEAPDSNSYVAGPRDAFGVVDSSLPPAAAVPPASLAISSLATELQAAATRLQNSYNSDNNTSTVTLADLATGVANPASFTPAEITAFGQIQAVFRDKAVASSDAKLVVSPGPGSFAKDETLGPVQFHITGTTKIDEDRSTYSSQMTLNVTATQTLATTAAMGANAQVIVLGHGDGETVFGAGAVPGNLTAGDYTFEVYENGQRTFSTNANLPLMTATTQIPLTDKLDYTLTSGLNPLVRNLTAATQTRQGSYWVYNTHYTYDTATVPPPAGVVQAAIDATTSPTVNLAVGRYSFAGSGATFYVYPNNVVWFNNRGTLVRLSLQANNGAKPTRLQGQANASWVTFDTANNQLYCSQCQPQLNVRLDNSMRDI